MKSIRGTVVPVCGALREQLTLHMQEGKTMDFFFTDANGSVTATGGISE
jgi:hypothetical protein